MEDNIDDGVPNREGNAKVIVDEEGDEKEGRWKRWMMLTGKDMKHLMMRKRM